jgi:hypothetical protein
VTPVEGLKSISELLLVFIMDDVASNFDFDVGLGKTIWDGGNPEGSEEVVDLSGISFDGDPCGRPCRRASRRALSLRAF